MNQKQIASIVAVLIAALVSGGIAWAQDTHGRISVVEERTEALEVMRQDIGAIQRDLATICEAVSTRRPCGR